MVALPNMRKNTRIFHSEEQGSVTSNMRHGLVRATTLELLRDPRSRSIFLHEKYTFLSVLVIGVSVSKFFWVLCTQRFQPNVLFAGIFNDIISARPTISPSAA